MAVILNRAAELDRFKDLDLNLTAHPVTGDITALAGETAIIRSLKNLVLLNFYEVPFNPDIGSEVTNLLFENFTPATESNIEDAIRRTISLYEPRVEIDTVTTLSDRDNGTFNVTIVFFIRNQLTPITTNIILERNK